MSRGKPAKLSNQDIDKIRRYIALGIKPKPIASAMKIGVILVEQISGRVPLQRRAKRKRGSTEAPEPFQRVRGEYSNNGFLSVSQKYAS